MDPYSSIGNDSNDATRAIYCYVIKPLDAGAAAETLYLTSHDGEIQIETMPAAYGADDPQVFSPGNIGHGPIRREGNFDKTTFELQAMTADMTGVSRYALTGAIPRIRVDVLKINPGPVFADEPAIWGTDTVVVQTGLIANLGFRGFGMTAECVPEPLFSQHEIPRWRFSRTCNRQLYGPDCGADPTTMTHTSNILALDPTTRTVTLQGQLAADTGDIFRQGVLLHQPTGIRLSVFSSALTGSDTTLRLHQWTPDLAVTDVAIARAGCRHTLEDCRDKFNNAANFGGFAYVPNKNPTFHGV